LLVAGWAKRLHFVNVRSLRFRPRLDVVGVPPLAELDAAKLTLAIGCNPERGA
jgi:hypothetical protein